ncbi:ribonuclease Z [Flavobacterium arcticum]|uniref:Ribonuclease Z n=1 Tax=Flavobacterium arcticum TaxID=1784713 RepID=A0A345HCY0_9FLAO|nr:ribonuclease Z [Flavobacterium arcticum]AXG74440.1 ribonuclease Z [Flavobacterium arcticum]KAF2512439.1 ribonuclease Z [Flavobacterium arcticum]
MNLTILGCYAATPRSMTNPTAQVLEIKNRMFLIDCGEGTQVQLRKNKLRFSKINHIFISHLHGDHFYGLIGLVSTFSLLNRNNDLHIYGPKGIKEVTLLQLKLSNSYTGYNLYFHELESKESEVVFEDDKVIVTTIPLVHRVYTNGYLFTEKPDDRKLNVDVAKDYGIETCYYQKIKSGNDITLDDGRVIPNAELTFDPPEPKSYAFCSDTVYNEAILPIIKDVDVLYHESTFLESEAHLCERTMHTTAKQAATIAKQANAGKLILGHFSTRYGNIEIFKEEASTIFENVELADDGKVFEL